MFFRIDAYCVSYLCVRLCVTVTLKSDSSLDYLSSLLIFRWIYIVSLITVSIAIVFHTFTHRHVVHRAR